MSDVVLVRVSEALSKIEDLIPELSDEPQVLQQLKVLRDSALECRDFLQAETYKIAFIGSIGVGKTTAICDLFDIKDSDCKPLLSTGSGRVTLCEVEIRNDTGTRIRIDPVDESEMRALLRDFVELIQSGRNRNDLSAEVVRCLRNMLDLPVRKRKLEDGGSEKRDLARERLDQVGSAEAFFDDVLDRIGLESRTKVYLEPSEGEDTDLWLRENFERINLGKDAEVPFPSRISIELNREALLCEEIGISVVDSKGLDGTSEREDIDAHLASNHTLSVIASRFSDAPEKNCQDLLDHMCRMGLKDAIGNRTLLMVIEREYEALKVIGDAGEVEDRDEGREVRLDQINQALIDIMRVPDSEIPETIFVNRSHDIFEPIRATLIDRLQDLRQSMVEQVGSLEDAVETIIAQREEERTRVAYAAVFRACEAWARMHRNARVDIHELYRSLVNAIDRPDTNAGWVRSSVNRSGSGPNFDFYYRLRLESRRRTVIAFEQAGRELLAVLENLRCQPEIEPAHTFIDQLVFIIENRLGKLNENASNYAGTEFQPPLRGDDAFWDEQQQQWGEGPGYKGRISARTESWFRDLGGTHEREEKIQLQLENDWNALVDEVEALARKPVGE